MNGVQAIFADNGELHASRAKDHLIIDALQETPIGIQREQLAACLTKHRALRLARFFFEREPRA